MKTIGRMSLLAVLLAAGTSALASEPPRASAGTPLQQTQAQPPQRTPVARLPPIVVPSRVEPRAAERIYNEAIIRDGTVDRVVQQLEAMCGETARPRRSRANACLLRSHLEWRHGRLAAAMAAVEAGLAVEPFDDLVYHKARLLDASGRVDETREWYQKALAATTNPELKETIRLRLTFVDAVSQNVSGLVELARTRPVDFRNRAAIALAILDFDREAADLYQISGDGSERFRQHVRVAQWAIKARNAGKAQEESWRAVQAATLDRDRNYGLSLLVEAHSIDKSLDRLLEKFAQQKTLTPEEQSVRVDLLRQTGQYQKAIDLFASAHGQALDPALRLELLRMYRDAGQDAAMIAEYRRLIANEPALTDWVEGLTQYYLEQNDRESARRVWEEFLGRNEGVDTLLFGSDSMASFGLHDLAVAATEKALARSRSTEDAARVRLAQFEMYRQRGLNTQAEAALAALDALLPAESPYRTELADAYERIQKPQLAARTLEGLASSGAGLGVDQRMRLAWLLDSTGRRDDALKTWREIWAGESLAARRRLVEERLLMLAAELGTLGELAVELEEKLVNGTAAPREVSLLVSIYTKVGDSVSAIEVVTTAAAQGGSNSRTEVESLKEQGQIYLALAEYPDFTRVMRRLIEIDPDNRVDYLQALLLNQIEAGADSTREQQDATAQLREWLRQLREVGGDAVGAEFEAGVLELAGFRDQAIDSYRRALAVHPERADDHLLLAELLRQAGRQAEGVASLQYIAEVADSDELFLIAVDGITNMRTGNAATVKWAQRRALERLTSRDDKIYLYEMLAELAEETKDAKVYIAALEASLAHADSRRSHVLRELLAVTAEVTTYEASQRVASPEASQNVAYARRLIALGEELPPDVYVDLGRTFIKLNDPAAARRAFNLAVDRTGRTSVVFEAAKLFEAGGFDREAITEYERALVADSGSLETMFRLARLRERSGAIETANDLYLRALVSVVNRQNRAIERGQERTPPALDTLVSFEHRRYYHVLLTGFLSTLPEDRTARAPRLQVLEQAFTDELRDVTSAAGGALAPLAYYPRLSVLAGTLRAAAFAVGVPAPADRADAALRQAFTADPGVAAQAIDDRRRWGYPVVADVARAGAGGTAGAAAERVKDAGDYLREIGLAMAAGDQDAALTVYRQWARFAGLPKPPIMLGASQLPDRSPGIPEVATHAWQRLDARRFGSLAQHILGLVTDQDAYAEKLILDLVYQYEVPEVPILTRLETALGQPLIEEERLLRLVARRTDWSLLNFNYVISNLSPIRQIELLERYSKASDLNWLTFLKSLGVVLRKPLEPAHAAAFTGMVKTAVQTGIRRGSGMQLLPNFMNYPFTAGIAPSNAPIVEEIEKFIAERHPQVFKAGYFRASLLRDIGRDQEALAAFVDAALQMYVPLPPVGTAIVSGAPSPYAYQSFVRSFAPFIFPKYKAEVMQLLEQREAGPEGLTPALISLRTELNTSDPSSDTRQFAAALQAMADRHPKNEQIRTILHPLYDQAGDTMKAIDVLTELTNLRPDNKEYRYRLVLLWQKLDYPENVVKVAGPSTVQELAPVVPRNYYIESVTGPPAVRFPTLKRAVDQIKAAAAGQGDQAQAGLGLRTLLQTLPPGGMSISEYAQIRDASDPYLYMRDFLQLDGEAPPRPATTTPAPANTFDRLLRSLELTTGETPLRAAKLTEVVGRSGFGIGPLESYLGTIRTADIDKHYIFFDMLANAYVSSGRADQELRQRTPRLLAGEMGQKDATIWLGLAARQPAVRAAELVQAAVQGGLTAGGQSGLQRLYLARLYSAAGQRDKALETYVSVATSILAGSANTLQPNTLATDPYGRDNGLMLFTGIGLFDEVRERIDGDALNAFVAEMLAMSRPPDSPTVQQAYGRFVNVLYVRAYRAGLAIPALQQEAATIQAAPGWSRTEVLQAAFARAHLGRTDEALALLKSTLRRDLESREPINTVLSNAMFASRQYQIALGLVGDLQMLGPFGTSGPAVEEFKPLFPAKADEWSGGSAWVSRVATELPAWIAQGTANRDAGMQVLSLVALRLHQMGEATAAHAAARELTAAFRAGPVSVKASTLAMSVAERAGAPIDLAILQDLVRANRLHISRVQAVIARTVQVEGAGAALRLGAEAARFTSDDGLLEQLVAIAQSTGNPAEIDRWTTRQQQASAARAQLARRSGSF